LSHDTIFLLFLHNPSGGPTGAQPPIQTWKYYKDFKTNTSESLSTHLDVANDAIHHDLNVPYIRNEIKRLSQRYADRMEKHSDIFATNLMKEVKTTAD